MCHWVAQKFGLFFYQCIVCSYGRLSVNFSNTFINREYKDISVLKQVLRNKDITWRGGMAPRFRKLEIR